MTTGEQLYALQMTAKNGDILPEQMTTYVLNEKGENRCVYFNDKSGVFASIKIGTDDPAFYLDIRRPLVVDCTGLENVDIPDMPEESDGIIFLHCGNTEGAAYVVRSEEQVIDI
ncbi:MAG: hypothetical protein M0P01_04760 [Treponema sp.]|nr:hypothetical protein [Treponema sp.]